MSYWPDMFKPAGEGIKAFLVHVNAQHDGVVVYKLDANGKPTSFANGTVKDALGQAIEAANPLLRVVEYRPHNCLGPARWDFWALRENRWRDLVRVLNGKSIRTGEYREKLATLKRHGFVTEIDYDNTGKHKLTAAGEAADAKLDAKATAEPSDPRRTPRREHGAGPGMGHLTSSWRSLVRGRASRLRGRRG